jgi:ankyrin repeat protein
MLLEAGAPTDVVCMGHGPLWTVAARSDRALAAALLEHGADPNRAPADGRTPLHRAAAAGLLGNVSMLLEHGADPNPADAAGRTPLQEAAWFGHEDAVRALLPVTEAEDNESLLESDWYAPVRAVIASTRSK